MSPVDAVSQPARPAPPTTSPQGAMTPLSGPSSSADDPAAAGAAAAGTDPTASFSTEELRRLFEAGRRPAAAAAPTASASASTQDAPGSGPADASAGYRRLADLQLPSSTARDGASAGAAPPPHAAASRAEAPPTPAPIPAPQAAAAAAPQAAETEPARSTARATVYDASTRQVLGDATSIDQREPAAAAAHNVQLGLDYYAGTFGRNGLDGAGSGVDVLVRDRTVDAQGRERFRGNGGYYATTTGGVTTEAIHFGVGKQEQGQRGPVVQHEMFHADDLAVHELTHGVIRKETGHLGGRADEAGATNEAIADVMAASATRDWSIGEGMYGQGSAYLRMRNIAQPDDPAAIHGLWTSMSEVNARRNRGEAVEEHWASGVLSTAAYRVQQRLGGDAGWQAVERVFYDSVDNDRLGDMSFTAVASALRTSAAAVYGAGSTQARVFDEELRRGGM